MTPKPTRSSISGLAKAAGVLAALCAAVAGGVGLASLGGTDESGPRAATSERKQRLDQSSHSQEPQQKRPEFFATDSVWNARLRDDAPIDPASDRLMAAFREEVDREQRASIGPFIQTAETSTPVYHVPRDQPKVPVRIAVTDEYASTLRATLARGVPIPRDAEPARGPDRHLTIYQPATDTLWELWRARKTGDGWRAEYGGVMSRVRSDPGYFTSESYPGSRPTWGATATSLPVVAGTMLIDELTRGRIDHALAMNLPNPRRGTFAWPAQRSDGEGGPDTLPEGARLRLDPAVDVRSLGLSRMGQMMALAAQRHGIVVRDKTNKAIGFLGEDPTPTGSNPYSGPNGFYEGGTPADVLRGFPWDRLQLVRMKLCDAAPCAPPNRN